MPLHNQICPYCCVVMNDEQNDPAQRTVEHLIPNTALRSPRSRKDGDFHACKSCNPSKSHIDFVLGVITKSQSRDPQFAADALIDAVTKHDGRSERFIEMLKHAVEEPDGVHFEIPIFGDELLEYMQFLGKGQYFRVSGTPFFPGAQVMLVDFINKAVLSAVESDYYVRHETNPFRDLEINKYSEVYSAGDCIIYSKNLSFLFIFHDYTSVIARIRRRNKKNSEREKRKNDYILRNFNTRTSPRAA